MYTQKKDGGGKKNSDQKSGCEEKSTGKANHQKESRKEKGSSQESRTEILIGDGHD